MRVQHGALVGLAVAVGVAQAPDVGDAVDQGVLRLRGRQRQHADGDVELVGEGGDLAGLAVGAEVFEDLDGVLALELAVLVGIGIFDGFA